jgi:hypothetical protein
MLLRSSGGISLAMYANYRKQANARIQLSPKPARLATSQLIRPPFTSLREQPHFSPANEFHFVPLILGELLLEDKSIVTRFCYHAH